MTAAAPAAPAAPGPAWRQRFAAGRVPPYPAQGANGGGLGMAPMGLHGTAVVTARTFGSVAMAPMKQMLPLPQPPALLPPPASSGGGMLPLQLIVQTAPAPPVIIKVPPAGSGGAGLALAVQMPLTALLSPAGSAGSLMPPLILFALPQPPQPPLAAWQKDVEGWAIAREQQVHVQALWQYGELAMFALMWSTLDFVAGLVPRCYRCWNAVLDQPAVQTAEQQIAAVYGQGNQYRCPVCFNTTFALPQGSSALPGLRALIIRPAMFTEFDKTRTRQPRGAFDQAMLDIESTPDFRVRNGDYVFRSDGTRFQLKTPRRMTLRTGFTTPWQSSAAITYNLSQASFEDPLTVCYQIPPPQDRLAAILGTYTRVPVAYDWAEVFNGPLIPEEAPSPASSGHPQSTTTFPLGFPQPDTGYSDTFTQAF